jgi:tryptophan 2-C-methyltransferase
VKVLLLNVNRMRPPVAPLGLELLASELSRRGLESAVLDLAWAQAPLISRVPAIARMRPAAIAISVRNLDDCYYASQSFLLPPIRRVILAIRRLTPAPVIVGGVGFSIAPEAALAYLEADYGIRGDGEDALPRLLAALDSGRGLEDVPGLVRPGHPAPPPAAWEGYGQYAPARGAFDLIRYFRRGGQGNLETGRGCNRKCIYCADPVAKGRRPRYRNPESVAEEMQQLVSLGVHAIHLCDCEFNLSRAHAEDVARAIIRAGLPGRVQWYTYALPKPMDASLARLLAASGCAGIDFSVDAANDEMLHALGRDFGVADLERCAEAMRAAGIPFMYDLLLGGPGETVTTMRQTVTRLKRIRPDRVGVSFGVRVFPGTALAKTVAAGPLADNPCLHGNTRHNDRLLRPLFYVSDRLGPDPEARLKKIIGDDPRFFFASRADLGRNYNYNNNRPLCAAIARGARGAYWDILRRGVPDPSGSR